MNWPGHRTNKSIAPSAMRSPAAGTLPASPGSHRPSPGTLELFRSFLVIGASGFGMAMMQTIRTTVVNRAWLSEEEVDEGLGVVQLYPGPMLVDLVAFVGYRLGRIRGALAAAVGFLAPSLALVLGLSWAYFRYGSSPATRDLAIGLDGVVVGVLASVTMDLAANHDPLTVYGNDRVRSTVTRHSGDFESDLGRYVETELDEVGVEFSEKLGLERASRNVNCNVLCSCMCA